jgi:2-hydroxychromene-2-carboxylate isomerase
MNTLQIMRGALAAGRLGCFDDYVDAVFRHMWVESRKMDDPEVVQTALAESGLPVEDLLAGMQDPEVKAELIANTEQSVERGTFGSPSFFVGEELWFGKDRLEDVEREIDARSGREA